jgi:hypothetical protein
MLAWVKADASVNLRSMTDVLDYIRQAWMTPRRPNKGQDSMKFGGVRFSPGRPRMV